MIRQPKISCELRVAVAKASQLLPEYQPIQTVDISDQVHKATENNPRDGQVIGTALLIQRHCHAACVLQEDNPSCGSVSHFSHCKF